MKTLIDVDNKMLDYGYSDLSINNKQKIKPNKMKTSKIKIIQSIAGDGIKWNGIYYHNLEMENGDKINIGKSKKQEVGWELTYEETGDGQNEYNKAKAVQKEQASFSAQKSDKVQTYIIRQSSLKIALDFMNVDPNMSQDEFTRKRLKELAENLTNYVLNGLN